MLKASFTAAAARLTLILPLVATSVAASESHQHRRFGGGHAVNVTELPDSELKRALENLPASARAEALRTLAGISFDENEVHHLHAHRNGGVLVDCFARVDAAPALPASGPVVGAGPVPVGSPPVYHSRPGSSRVAYLDFNGHVITGTAWNSGAAASYSARAYDLDGDPSTFSDAEQSSIYQVWARVAEDYAPFDIDVTTQEPATMTSTCGRILITSNTDNAGVAMPYSTAGGVAYINVFGNSNYVTTYSPALVYYNNLGGGRADYVAEAAAHEFGHNCGLSHDGTTTGSAYYGGQGSGATSWAPIMGTGYNHNVSQWSKGEYANANNQEDDLAKIAAKLTYRPDDVGDNAASATSLSISGGAFSASGVIGSTPDVDVFRVTVGSGTLSATVTTIHMPAYTSGGNLDARVRIVDGGGNVLADSDPGANVDASTSANVAAGTYYIEVHGSGDPGNYSDYGSLGQYALNGTATASGGGDSSPPSVSITQPGNGSTVSGTVTLAASASDNVGVTRVDWLIDGGTLGSATVSPYNLNWNTTGYGNGGHSIVARAVDAAGNVGTSSTFSVTVNNVVASNGASFVSASLPSTMTTRGTYPVSVTMNNSGTTTWSAAGLYRLGSQNPQDNSTWGMSRVSLPNSVSPGQNVTFSFNVTAPASAGSYNFQWRMVQDNVEWFGAYSTNVAVTVSAAQPPPPPPPPSDVVWVGDSVPAGGIQAGDGEGWNWIGSNPTPFSGSLANQSNAVGGVHQHYFYGATQTLSVASGDVLMAYVYLDPANVPSEVMLQWNDGSWEHRAYWGANQVPWGTDGTVARRYMGALPAAGLWVRLEVPASTVGLEGRTLNGLAFTLSGGRATWDHAGKRSGSVVGGGLVAHWKLDDGAGSSAADASGNNNTGSLLNGPTWTGGISGGALALDGVNDYVSVADNAGLRLTGDCTFALWMKKNSEAADWQRLLGKGNATLRNFGVWEEAGAGKHILFQQYDASGAAVVNLFSNATVEVGSWYHIACVVSGSTVSIYVNGSLNASGTRSGTPVASADPLTLGYAGFHTFFPGALDDVRVYNKALTAAEIAALAATSTPTLDGGFEAPSVGSGGGAYVYNVTGSPWTFNAGSGISGNGSGFTSGNPSAPEGAQVAFLQSVGWCSQNVNFSAGSFAISLRAAQRGNWQASTQTFRVRIDGTEVGRFTPSSTSYGTYTTSSFSVTAGTHAVILEGLNPNGGDNTVFVDQVVLSAGAGMPTAKG